MPNGSVCSIAFIIEGISVKISSKNQRKFAILTISDAVESCQLPIWSDLYEAHVELLNENQMLCAVIQKEMQEDKLRLQCRWLASLTADRESLIAACNTAYDLASKEVKQFALKEKKRMEKVSENSASPPKRSRLCMTLDADILRLSHILAIKDLFRSYPGNIGVEIEFISAQGKIAVLQIDPTWGVEDQPAFEKKISSLRAIKGFSWN